ncbi:MAG: ABC transporter ATP-binding protein [Thermoplasmata archaeon]
MEVLENEKLNQKGKGTSKPEPKPEFTESIEKEYGKKEKEKILSIRNLKTQFFTYDGVVQALDGINLDMYKGETLGIVGETGCGKSVMANSIMRLIPDPPGRIVEGEIIFKGVNLLKDIEKEATIKVLKHGARIKRNKKLIAKREAFMRTIRGKEIAMIFQEPMSALNPVYTAGQQISESIILHQKSELCDVILTNGKCKKWQIPWIKRIKELDELNKKILEKELQPEVGHEEELKKLYKIERKVSLPLRIVLRVPILSKMIMKPIEEEAMKRAQQMLTLVNIPDPAKVLKQYPHELSGGMQQRVMIAMALSCNPSLLIADEPTTALDVTIQAQILELMKELKRKVGASIMLITHDLGVVAETCSRVAVMYAGNIVECAEVKEIFSKPMHPYTKGLLSSIPKGGKKKEELVIIKGSVPNLITPPSGCRFHPRCNYATERCSKEKPRLTRVSEGHEVACFLYEEEKKETIQEDATVGVAQ